MPDAPLPAPQPPTRDRRAFAWTFGVCVAFPLVGLALLLVGGSLESSAATFGMYALFLSPVVWLLGIVLGVIARVQGQTAQGNGMLLGALVGAVVGFSLCSGAGLLSGTM